MRKRKGIFAGLTAAALFLSSGCAGTERFLINQTDSPENEYELAQAIYPEMAPYPEETKFIDEKTGEWMEEEYSAAYDAWRGEKRDVMDLPEANGKVLEGFSKRSIRQFLLDSSGENQVYSPVNVYLALAMMAEITEGESRQQILNLLETDSIETLRTHGENIWKLCYSNDGAVTSILANSLWLREGMNYHQDTLDLLARCYYASSYQGEMGTEEGIFYGPDGEIHCPFMNSSYFSHYYWDEEFAAAALGLNESGQMWLILPDEEVTVDEILRKEAVFDLINSSETWENTSYLRVNLSLPRFDAASEISLAEGLKALGVQDIFDGEKADFSPLADSSDGVYLSQAQHASRVKVDEKGVEAASYTVMTVSGAAMPPEEEVDFVLNRPFFFVITSRTGLPLFAGIVNQPGNEVS